MKLLIDYETRSRADLKKTGQHGYAVHPSTELLCLGWKVIGESGANVISCPGIYLEDPLETKEFYYAFKHAETIVAHNAPFEQAIYKFVHHRRTPMGKIMREVTPQDWLCTLAMCSVMSLPRGLANANEALGLKIKKDTESRKLLLKMCKPRPMKNDLSKWQEWVDDQPHLERLYEYCRQDIFAEEALYLKLKDYKPFTDKERKLWLLDQKINQRGFYIDLKLVNKTLELIKSEETTLTKELRHKTFGWVGTAKQTANLKSFLSDQGVDMPNMQKKTVDDTLAMLNKEPHKNTEAIEVLKIRQSLGRSSTSKYQAFKDRVDLKDLRVRDNLLYHGASTGRWSGSGVQPQNFPRGTVKVNEHAFSDVKEGDLAWLKISYGRPMDLFSSMLRGVIRATPGYELFCADYSSIEARVLLWCAEDFKGLREYESGIDAYKAMASVIYGVSIEDVTPEQRQLGKQVVLACGYQMGVKKFKATAAQNGLDVPESLLQRAHEAFRIKYPKVPQVWTNYEQAAIRSVLYKKAYTVNQVTWFVNRDFLCAKLPSGRCLYYYKPRVQNEETPWGELRPKLYHYSVDSLSKKWLESATYGGKLTENIVQAISRDCMAEAMPRVEDKGFKVLITVHDEVLTEAKLGTQSLETFKKLMSERPDWGLDIPLSVSGYQDTRYKK